MPSSTWVHTSTVQDLVWKYQPDSVLDVGVGFGRWGFLIREQMDIFKGRYFPGDWKTKIVGVEVFPRYILNHHRSLYTEIYIGGIEEYLKRRADKFDFIIAGDVIEHFEKERALSLLSLLRERADKALVICLPLGTQYSQGECFGNKYEAHRSTWEITEFTNANRTLVVKERIRHRPYGVVLYTGDEA